jgi:acyl-CoA reductase-like NAD-dependent aldehyde dehydrogenase
MARAALREAPASARWRLKKPDTAFRTTSGEEPLCSRRCLELLSRPAHKGVVSESKDVVEIASPRGVVAGIIPSTNPTSTAIFKILIAIKSRNAVVLSPHPSAAKCINETARVMREAAVKEGLPADAIGCMTTATIEGTEALMKHKQTAVILATGGIGLVRAAYSSANRRSELDQVTFPFHRTNRRCSQGCAGYFDRQVFR